MCSHSTGTDISVHWQHKGQSGTWCVCVHLCVWVCVCVCVCVWDCSSLSYCLIWSLVGIGAEWEGVVPHEALMHINTHTYSHGLMQRSEINLQITDKYLHTCTIFLYVVMLFA